MIQLTDRCFNLRDDAMNLRSMDRVVEPQYTIWSSVALRDLPRDTSLSFCISHTISMLAENFPPVIRENELIVGDNFGKNEYFDASTERLSDRNFLYDSGLTEAQVDFVLARMKNPPAAFPYARVAYTDRQSRMNADWTAIGRCIDANHSVLGYERVVKLGFEGLLREVEEMAKAHPESADLYESAIEICRGGCLIGERYAEHAEEMAYLDDVSPERRDELLTIAETCRRVPRYPATNLREAIQSLWFAHVFNTWEDRINANSIGRLDQILYPYYKIDSESGHLTDTVAYELIACLWVKLYRDYDVQQSCIGGCKSDGGDAVNRLSYIMLDVTEQLDFIRCMSVRFSQNTDRAFVRRALEVVGHVGKGIPFFFNDDVMIPALTEAGISLEDARGYTQIGCVETVIPGKSNPHAVSGETNLLKALEYVILNGHSMTSPDGIIGLETGELTCFDSYEKLKSAVYTQIYDILDTTCQKIHDHTIASETNSPRPYKSLLTEGCLESGRDFNRHGSKYDYYQVMLGGVPNLADSLEVLRRFVYENKKYTLEYVAEQLKADFSNERLRLEFVNKAAKYGNDIDSVDSIAAEIIDRCCDMLDELSQKYSMKFHAQPFTFLWMVDHGHTTGATPDGRRRGEVIAYSMSAMQGRDLCGLIALMNSLSKLPTKRTPGTTSAIVEIDPKLFNEQNLDRITDILITAAKKGLSNIQFNNVSVDTLLDAREHPEKHGNLAVRVSGFSQKFNLLSPELQSHIIERTKHQCL